jgi:two-component system phosphate regulon response regulator OmpR
MKSILIIDDDLRLLSLMSDLLTLNGFKAICAESASKARSTISAVFFDCVIVDWMMPYESGIDFVKSLRASSHHSRNVPILMLTAMSEIDNKIIGFESGLDDYLTKPFEERELIARLNALIKRSNIQNTLDNVVRFGDCRFHTRTGELLLGAQQVYLSTIETSLLQILCIKPNCPFSREELSKGLMYKVSDRTVDVQIARLRKKIGDNSKNPEIIRTIRHLGYAIKIKD